MRTTMLLVLAATLSAMTGLAAAAEGSAYAQWKNGPPHDRGYFPIGVWLQSPRNAPKFEAAGINFYLGLWQGPTEQQLAELKAHGMPVICAFNAVGWKHRDDPIIVGWMHGDEPDNAQLMGRDPETNRPRYGSPVPPAKVVHDYEWIRGFDPSRPVFLNLGQGVANDQWRGRGSGAHISDYLTYVKGADIVSFDVYPVVGIRKPDGENYLWYVPKGVDRLRKWSEGSKIIWNIVECTHIGNPTKKATPHQVRAEVWMSLIHGSRGIVYFVHQFKPKFIEPALLHDPQMLAAVTAINRQIHRLAPVLNSPTADEAASVASSSEDVPIDVMVKRHEGATYLFAVGMRNAAADGTFSVRNLPERATAEVLDEDRSIAVQGGRFEDHFEAYGVHVYRIQ